MFQKIISMQFRKPKGILAHYAANFMKKNNQEYFDRVIEMLEIEDEDTLLEIGCGAGFAIDKIAAKNKNCRIDGLDFSSFMIRKAAKHNREHIKSGRVKLRCQNIYDKGPFEKYSKIFAINVIYFWNDLYKIFVKIGNLLEGNGRFIVFMSSPERLNTVPFISLKVFKLYTLDYVKDTLLKSGFKKVTHQTVSRNGTDTYQLCAYK
jgi:cyclopropane fatty-acyl-phospholipid synthase-like methyltransferase